MGSAEKMNILATIPTAARMLVKPKLNISLVGETAPWVLLCATANSITLDNVTSAGGKTLPGGAWKKSLTSLCHAPWGGRSSRGVVS